VNSALRVTAVGTKTTVATQLRDLITTYQPDEIMLTGMIHDHQARLNSFKMAAEIMQDLAG
jgi:alkanesulfonate monooxygenase SsuD/methylene tetrahydromethanopterin reductase-like flavin-dependent oxidoreductase (luciferase family)